MKRNQHFILLLSILVSVSAKSQFNKGDRLIGGAVNVSSSTSSSSYINSGANNYFGSGLVPRYSWVRKNNIMNGIFLNANYSHSKTDGNPGEYQSYDSYGVGLGYFIRNYKDFSQQFGWFLEYNALVSYGFNKQQTVFQMSSSNTKSSSVTAGLNVLPGLYYKVSSAAVIEAGFGGVSANYSNGKSGGNKSHSFNIGLNFPSNFTFGLQFLIGHKRNDKS